MIRPLLFIWLMMMSSGLLAQQPSRLVGKTIRLALPMAGSRLIQMLSGFIGMLMLAHLGHDVLAAGALMTSAMMTILVVLVALLFSMGVMVGQAWGAGKKYEIGAIIQQGCVLALIISIPAMVLIWYVDRFLLWTGQLPQLIVYVRQYFHALEWAIVPYMLIAALQQACYGMLRQRLVIIINSFCLLVFLAACYVLIYGKLGVKAYGVAGLGYAFSIQAWLNLLLLVISFYVLPDFKPLQIFAKRNHKGWHYLRQLLQIGWPMSAQFGGELFSFFVISIMVGWLGKAPLAASQVIQQVLLLFLVPMFAVAESTGILVSQSVGAQQYTEVKRIGNVCVALSLVMVIFLGLLFIIFPRYFAAIYMNIHNPANADVLQLIDILFVITAFTLIFDTLRDVSAGALRGLYDTRFAMWAGITANWIVALPLGYILAFPLHMGVVGFRLALTLAVLFGAILVYWRWQRRAKQLITTEKSALPK